MVSFVVSLVEFGCLVYCLCGVRVIDCYYGLATWCLDCSCGCWGVSFYLLIVILGLLFIVLLKWVFRGCVGFGVVCFGVLFLIGVFVRMWLVSCCFLVVFTVITCSCLI